MTEPREIRPPFELDKNNEYEKDFRLQRDRSEPDPKASSVPEPADSSDSTQLELELKESPASVAKDNTQPKVNGTGLPTSPPVISPGKTTQPAKA